jgi:predicted nuclease with TOPRIM domain
MKLSEFLNSIVGKTFTEKHITSISSEVDGIKARALEKEKESYTELNESYKKVSRELKEFKTSQSDALLKEAFQKSGGDLEKFESFKKVSGKIEKVEDVKFDEIFNEFPNLKSETDFINNLANQSSNTGAGDTKTQDTGTSADGLPEGDSLIV